MPAAIVTASESGIGRAAAVALARRGHDIGITWIRDEAGGEATAKEVRRHGVRTEVRRLDLREHTSVRPCIDALAEALGGVDVLVNVAAVGSDAPAIETSLDDWQHVLDVSLTGAFLACQAAAQRMIDQGRGGRIVNVTSVHEHVPLPNAVAYCAAKGGLGMVTKCLALELAGHGITVNAVAPGETATAMTGAEDEDPYDHGRPAIPAGRPGDAREMAAAIAFLASPEAGYVTGQSLPVDGGMLLMAAVANLMANP